MAEGAMLKACQEITLTVPERIAEALKATGVPDLEADFYVVPQALRWNIDRRAHEIGVAVEQSDPSYSKIAELAGQVQALASACEQVERGERMEVR